MPPAHAGSIGATDANIKAAILTCLLEPPGKHGAPSGVWQAIVRRRLRFWSGQRLRGLPRAHLSPRAAAHAVADQASRMAERLRPGERLAA